MCRARHLGSGGQPSFQQRACENAGAAAPLFYGPRRTRSVPQLVTGRSRASAASCRPSPVPGSAANSRSQPRVPASAGSCEYRPPSACFSIPLPGTWARNCPARRSIQLQRTERRRSCSVRTIYVHFPKSSAILGGRAPARGGADSLHSPRPRDRRDAARRQRDHTTPFGNGSMILARKQLARRGPAATVSASRRANSTIRTIRDECRPGATRPRLQRWHQARRR